MSDRPTITITKDEAACAAARRKLEEFLNEPPPKIGDEIYVWQIRRWCRVTHDGLVTIERPDP